MLLQVATQFSHFFPNTESRFPVLLHDHLVFMSFTVILYNYNQLQDLITLRRIDYNQYPMTPRLLVLELECVSGVEVT